MHQTEKFWSWRKEEFDQCEVLGVDDGIVDDKETWNYEGKLII